MRVSIRIIPPSEIRHVSFRQLEVCHRRCAMAGVSFSMLSLGGFCLRAFAEQDAELAGPSETPWRTYHGTPTTACSM